MEPALTDRELLAAFVRHHASDALRALVARHLDLVYGSALRQLRDPGGAEDVTQAVFILLAKRAGSIRDGRLLPAWLLQVTRFCAAAARRSAARRRTHEQEAAAMRPTVLLPDVSPEWRDIAVHLDAALAHLPTLDRTAIVLRFLENRPLGEVAAELGLSEEAIRKRIARALAKLRQRFAHHGAILSVALLSAFFAQHAHAVAAPTGLLASTSAAAGTLASTSPAARIAKSALKMMAWHSARLAAAIVILTLVLLAPAIHFARHGPVAPPPSLAASPATLPVAPATPAALRLEFLLTQNELTRAKLQAAHYTFRETAADNVTDPARDLVQQTTGNVRFQGFYHFRDRHYIARFIPANGQPDPTPHPAEARSVVGPELAAFSLVGTNLVKQFDHESPLKMTRNAAFQLSIIEGPDFLQLAYGVDSLPLRQAIAKDPDQFLWQIEEPSSRAANPVVVLQKFSRNPADKSRPDRLLFSCTLDPREGCLITSSTLYRPDGSPAQITDIQFQASGSTGVFLPIRIDEKSPYPAADPRPGFAHFRRIDLAFDSVNQPPAAFAYDTTALGLPPRTNILHVNLAGETDLLPASASR